MKQGMKGYTFREVTLHGGTVVQALVRDDAPHLCFHDATWGEDTMFTVTHVPSGRALGNFATRKYAAAQLEALARIDGLEAAEPDRKLKQIVTDTIACTYGSYDPAPARKTRPVAEGEPVILEPVYRPGFTPSVAVRARDRVLAREVGRAMEGQGDKGALDAAATAALDAAWEEEFMVRVPGLKREEIPPRSQGPYYLLDGRVCNYAGFAVSAGKLDAIGDQLKEQAEIILELAEGAGYWDRDDRRAWREACANFSRLVAEGWIEWTECAAHYIASTPKEQQMIVDELGFVGNREQGYHALGVKTFLRHPEILRAAKERDRVKDERL